MFTGFLQRENDLDLYDAPFKINCFLNTNNQSISHLKVKGM